VRVVPPYYLPPTTLSSCEWVLTMLSQDRSKTLPVVPSMHDAARLLPALGFAQRQGEILLITPNGVSYAYASNEGVRVDIVVDALRVGVPLTATIADVLGHIPQGLPVSQARAAIRSLLSGFESWDAATARVQCERYCDLLVDLNLTTPDLQLTRSGIAVAAEAPGPTRPRNDARVWLIRAGRDGANEELAREHGVSVIGWSKLGPLAANLTNEQLASRIGDVYGEPRAASLSAQASSIRRFIDEVQLRDLVVLPLQGESRRVSVGVISGEYRYRDDGEFADADAKHTRDTRWIAWGVPYAQFDDELQAAFGQRGTISEISREGARARTLEGVAAADESIHLVLKWSEKHGKTTIEDHRDIAQREGEVWWSVIGRADRRKLGARWRELLESQLAAGTPTYAYVSGPTCWTTQLVDITDDPDVVPPHLVAASPANEYSLWVKLVNFQPTTREWLLDRLDLASSAGRPLSQGALGNQTNPLIVRRAGPRRAATRRVWWVNQGRSYDDERAAGVLWAGKVSRSGAVLEHRRALAEVGIDDLVLHYTGGAIKAVSVVTDEAVDGPAPHTGSDERDGWLVRADYRELATPVPLSEILEDARKGEGGPFDRNGDVNQGYLYPLSDRFVNELARTQPALELDGDSGTLIAYAPPPFAAIETAFAGNGLRIEPHMLKRYHASLQTRGFVILAGISGGGKTWLAELYAKEIGAIPCLVAVAPNWTANEDLIGYAPALGAPDDYRHTEFSRFLMDAAAEYESATSERRTARPYHLILDEMNLARVEYYFAKFLSAMEQRSRDDVAMITLSDTLKVPLTPNLKFIGTVNVDETTHGFADKVYDRAQLIELGVSRDALAAHLTEHAHGDVLLAMWDAVSPVAPFAFRVADEIAAYLEAASEIGVDWHQALDDQVLQKILPKVTGTDRKLGEALGALAAVLADRFPRSAAKTQAMLADYTAHGLVDYF
jgi:hypothetical protein